MSTLPRPASCAPEGEEKKGSAGFSVWLSQDPHLAQGPKRPRNGIVATQPLHRDHFMKLWNNSYIPTGHGMLYDLNANSVREDYHWRLRIECLANNVKI